MKTNIIPSLKEIKLGNETVKLADYSLSEEYSRLVPVARETLDEFSVKLGGKKLITAVENKSLKAEEYKLSVSANGIVAEYSSFNGAYYAIVTLCQLARINRNVISVCEIHDRPDMSVRALSDDISRGQVSKIENFKSIIRRLSYWKYNLYFPYIEDTFDFRFLPCPKEDYALNGDEWKELCAYAKNYGVTVRPLFNLLCHFKACTWPEYSPYVLKNDKGQPQGCLDPLAPDIRTLIGNMLDEIVEAFGEGAVHAGCDESDALAYIYGKEKAEDLYCNYINMLDEELHKRNCSLMIYGDMFYTAWGDYAYGYDAIKKINRDITIVYWAYWSEPEFPDIMKFVNDGWKLVISPASRSYNRFYPAYISYENMKYICRYSAGKVDSMIISSWNDNGAILREENMVAFSFGSEFCWDNHSQKTYEELLIEYLAGYFGLENVELEAFTDVYHFETYFEEPNVNSNCEISTFICREFWKKAEVPATTEFNLHEMAPKIRAKLEKALSYIETLDPKSNKDTFDCLIFDIKRMIWGLKRAELFPTEQAEPEKLKETVSAHPELMNDYKKLHAENERLWMYFNKRSEWSRLDNMYNRVEQSFESVREAKK